MSVDEWTIPELQAKFRSGELSSRRLTELYLDRIESIDRHGPRLNSVIEVNPEALDIAGRRDDERASGRSAGPLHGIPVLIKDNIDTHDRMQTTSGSLALDGTIAPADAFVAARLRAAGAIILGKTNLSEWANFRGKPSISGWSSRGGLTRNPYALDRSACGSSSGSAVAVAANLCAAAIGTETDGSIICPSQTNGIVGIKPTVGLWSRSGIVPISHRQDTAGPMARTVEDAAILLGALTGVDARDKATRKSRDRAERDYTRHLKADGLRGSRIGVARKLAGKDPRVVRVFERALDLMKAAGASLIDPVEVAGVEKVSKPEIEALYFEFKADLNRYLAAGGSGLRVRSLKDVIKFNEQHHSRVMPFFGQERMLAAQTKGPLTSKKYRAARAASLRLARTEGLDATIRKHRLDCLVVPSGGPAWLVDLVDGDSMNWEMESTSLPAVAGYPHITVPAGYIFGLPVGLSFIGKAWQEPILLKLAYSFEQASRVRQPPQFKPSVVFDDAEVDWQSSR